MEPWQFLVAAGVPSGLFAFGLWLIEHRIEQREKARAEEDKKRREAEAKREQSREELQICIYETSLAAIALGEATAKAVQRIPDAHCNGDMHSALEYATSIKHKQKEFLDKQGISALLDD